MVNDCIIMAGGSGTRLWPASTSKRPKQFLSLPGPVSGRKAEEKKGSTFFGAGLERALSVTAEDGKVIIIAGKNHVNHIIEECSGLDTRERKRLVLIPEPAAKNTGPAIACALLYINWIYGGTERNVLVLTSDHIIKPLNVFKTDAGAAAAMARTDKLAVFGIRPDRPETGYGYIETAETLTSGESLHRRYEPEIFKVASFHEKPDLKKAKAYIAAGRFYWNSGMFAFSSGFMLQEFQRSAPEVILPFKKLRTPDENACSRRKGLRILEAWDGLEEAYRKTRALSFDYAIAEKCRDTVMVKAGFSWADVGSWDEYAKMAGHSEAELYIAGETAKTCFVDSDIPVALCAVEDLVVVVRSGKDGGPPAVLISKKGETQRVREIVEKIKASGRTGLL